jgi:hypothetical protein
MGKLKKKHFHRTIKFINIKKTLVNNLIGYTGNTTNEKWETLRFIGTKSRALTFRDGWMWVNAMVATERQRQLTLPCMSKQLPASEYSQPRLNRGSQAQFHHPSLLLRDSDLIQVGSPVVRNYISHVPVCLPTYLYIHLCESTRICIYQRTTHTSNSTQNPSWEVDSRSAGKEILHLLWNLKFQYRLHNILPPKPIISQMNPAHTFTPYFFKINLNIILTPTSKSLKRSFTFRLINGLKSERHFWWEYFSLHRGAEKSFLASQPVNSTGYFHCTVFNSFHSPRSTQLIIAALLYEHCSECLHRFRHWQSKSEINFLNASPLPAGGDFSKLPQDEQRDNFDHADGACLLTF